MASMRRGDGGWCVWSRVADTGGIGNSKSAAGGPRDSSCHRFLKHVSPIPFYLLGAEV